MGIHCFSFFILKFILKLSVLGYMKSTDTRVENRYKLPYCFYFLVNITPRSQCLGSGSGVGQNLYGKPKKNANMSVKSFFTSFLPIVGLYDGGRMITEFHVFEVHDDAGRG